MPKRNDYNRATVTTDHPNRTITLNRPK